ncbi:BatD family protein [Hymenobacter sp. 5516J-16]|uniref:BatD family protein n=1 Tax=Hymenobacter sp. 5516J-16 TaxID=2932253 RepID=UPI001FD150CB|nr:BatD family protein [Hymenobacter sp. 5516J-16]UOQ78367.1 BatD family protein [Hymenobacter sp. 5516J-16]
MRFFLLLLGVLWVGCGLAAGQNQPPTADIVLGKSVFPINEYYTISFRLRGAPLERYSAFPEIEGFKKSGKSSTTTTRTVNGQSSTELTITQRYAAFAQGTFTLKPFSMTVNGLAVRSEGATLRVNPQQAATTPAVPAPPAPGASPLQGIGLLDKLFGKPKPQEYVEPQDQAFLAVVPDKNSVFVGEGVHVGLYFYLAPQDQAVLNFYNFAQQLPSIIRQLRQRTVWEESFNEQEVLPENVTVGGKPFLRYRLWEAELYPLNTQPLTFPAVALQMVKYKVAKKPAPGLDNRLAGYKIYYSSARTIPVKPLPAHPLRDQVPVGSYEVKEAIDRTTFQTGKAFTYTFTVEGEGNLAAINLEAPPASEALEVYGPEVQQELTREGGRVGGRKSFQFRLVARRPGPVALDTLFQVVVFNPATARYDTLRAELQPVVRGPVRTDSTFRARLDDPFYRTALPEADATPHPRDTYRDVRRYANMVVVALLMMAGIGWWRARR